MFDTTRISSFWPIAAIGLLTAGTANAEMFKGYPDVIICHAGDSRVIAYLAGLKDDGSALYKPLLAEFYGTVTPDHIFHHQGTKDCDGKSIDQLEKDGQTRTLGSGGG
jgi:hypothetical protein